MLRLSLLAGLLRASAACAASSAPPDLVLVNGRIFAGVDSRPWADLAAIPASSAS